MTVRAVHPGAGPTFVPPPDSDAVAPPERRGVARDGVRLLVAAPGHLAHRHFADLPALLDPGDLVVINTSSTLPAAVDARRTDGRRTPVHVSTQLDDGAWVVEPRRSDNRGAELDVRPGEEFELPGGLVLRLTRPYPVPVSATGGTRLWRALAIPRIAITAYLPLHGRPIGYAYLADRYPIEDFQTVYATEPGSAEMPSAGRPFTTALLVRLIARGVGVAPVMLHAGVSSAEPYEPPLAERFAVPAATARWVESTRAAGQRVVAVGTTVARALETATDPTGTVHAAHGWTELVLGPDRPARVVTGLVTGLHAPQASHLRLLEAVAGAGLVAAAYDAAVEQGYLWHEFGDSMLFLP